MTAEDIPCTIDNSDKIDYTSDDFETGNSGDDKTIWQVIHAGKTITQSFMPDFSHLYVLAPNGEIHLSNDQGVSFVRIFPPEFIFRLFGLTGRFVFFCLKLRYGRKVQNDRP